MTIFTIPARLRIERITWGQQRDDNRFEAGNSGAGQTRVYSPPRWTAGLVCASYLTREEAAIWRSLILGLDGRIHQLALHDMDNPEPMGTLRGAPVLGAGAAAGATSILVSAGLGYVGATLLKGDWIGVGSGLTRQLLSVAADTNVDGSGNMAVTFKPSLRTPMANGSAVVLDRPTALFRQTTSDASWSFQAQVRSGYTLDLIESWET